MRDLLQAANIDLDWQGWFVIATLACAFLIMAADKAGPDLVFTILLAIYVTAGIVPVATASTGYSNTGLLTVIFLYLVAEGINQTGGLEKVMQTVLGRSRSPFLGLTRMMLPCMVLSAFLNNTPIVALLIPVITAWCRKNGIPIKKMLMPLSIAAVLGGTITLIGTSTNLVVSGAQQQRYSKSDPANAQFRIFDIAPYGIPYAIWGFLFVIFMERWLLPGNSSRYETDLLLAIKVSSKSPVLGQTLDASGLRSAYGLKIAGIFRNKIWIKASDLYPEFVLLEGDVIYVIGEFDNVEYYAEELGLDLHSSEHELGSGPLFESNTTGYTNLIQVKVKPSSSLVGTPLLSANLGKNHGLTAFGFKRGKDRKDSPFSDFVIAANDILILDAGVASDITRSSFLSDFTDVHEIKAGLARVYIIEAIVTGREVFGHTVSGAGLRGIPGISVVALDPLGDFKSRQEPVPYTSVIAKGDTLWIAADLTGVTLLARFPGIEFPNQQQITKTGAWFQWFQGKTKSGAWFTNLGFFSRWLNQYYVDSDLLEQYLFAAILSPSSAYVGHTVQDIQLRSKINGAVYGIHREGVRHPLSVTTTVLQAGDSILIGAPITFFDAQKHNNNFLSLSRVANSNPPKKSRGTLSLFLGFSLVLSQIIPGVMSTTWVISRPERKGVAPIVTSDWINLWSCAVLTSAVMLITGCFTGDQARASILWDVYLAIGGAFGVSATMERTNVANEFAQIFIIIAQRIGGRGAGLTAIYVATALLSEILTNNASGAIMYPIAAIAGDKLKIEPRAMSVAIMLGASAGFINPFSYQTNMMVYAAGNYKFIEFVKFGTPFQIYLLVVAGFILSFYDDWHQVWIVSFVALAAIIGPPLVWSILPQRFTRPVDLWIEKKYIAARAYIKGKKNPALVDRSPSTAVLQDKSQL